MQTLKRIVFSPPILVIVTGVPGSGKTVLSLGLNDNHGIKIKKGVIDYLCGFFYINKDMINDGFTEERSGDFFSVVRKGTYKAIDNIIIGNLQIGNSVWIDATYAKEVKDKNWAYRYSQICREFSAKLKIIRCVADEKIIRKRLAERGYERDRGKLENWEKFLQDEPIYLDVPYNGLVLDRSDSLAQNVAQVLKFLRK